MEYLRSSKAGLEIETCLYNTDYAGQQWQITPFEIIDGFILHLRGCLDDYDTKLLLAHDVNIDYTNWQLVGDRSIRCPINLEQVDELEDEEIEYAEDYRLAVSDEDLFNYASVEIVTSVYDYDNIDLLTRIIDRCLLSDDYAYGFNSSQGIHYNISNTIINSQSENDRLQTIQKILELVWILEPLIISYLPEYRQNEVIDGTFCNSLRKVFGSLKNMKSNWKRFFTIKKEKHKEVNNGLGKFFLPKYTMINVKNITEESSEGVYFEFRFGSIHMISEVMKAWIKMLSVIIASALSPPLYEILANTIKLSLEKQEKQFTQVLLDIGGREMFDDTIGIIERLPTEGGPGTG